MITAKFGSKEFKVSASQIYTPEGTSISESIEFEETEVSKKKPTQKIKAIKLQSMSFDIKLNARFVNVQTELRWWKNKMFAVQSEIFILGSTKIGKFYVTQYDVKDVQIDKNGTLLKATLSLTFTEDGKYANSNKISFESTKKAASVKSSATTKTSSNKNIKVGTYVKPKSGTRWYYTAEGALKRTGKSGKAQNKKLKVTYVYKNGQAINPQGLGWMRPEDVDVV